MSVVLYWYHKKMRNVCVCLKFYVEYKGQKNGVDFRKLWKSLRETNAVTDLFIS